MLRSAYLRSVIARGAGGALRLWRHTLMFILPKTGFPWVRLTLGVYLMLAGTLTCLRMASGSLFLDPSSKFVIASSWMAGTLFFASGLWAEIERRTSN